MAGEPRKEEPSKKLSFFKKAQQEPVAQEESTSVATAVAPAPEPAAAPSADRASEAELEARAKAGGDGEATGDRVPAAGAEAPKGDAADTEVGDQPKSAKAKRQLRLKLRMPTVLAPGLGLVARALVILAIIVVDACAAFLVVRAIAPRLAASKARQAVANIAPVEKPKAAGEGGSPAGQEKYAGSIDLISDLIVNPAGTDGTRYLCTTVALETIDPKVSEEIKSREPQIRDTLIEILGKRTTGELADLGTRDQLRTEIKAGVNKLLTGGEVEGVYFSNFVLQ